MRSDPPITSANLPPFPVNGLVPLFKRITRIVSVGQHPLLGHTYTLHTQDPALGLVIHHNMSREQLIEQIEEYAAFGERQKIVLPRYGEKVIAARRWSFKEGRAYYRIADPREKIASKWIPEERLKTLVEEAAQQERAFNATHEEHFKNVY